MDEVKKISIIFKYWASNILMTDEMRKYLMDEVKIFPIIFKYLTSNILMTVEMRRYLQIVDG